MSASKIEVLRPHRRVEIQVPTPAALSVHGESRKIQKPPKASTTKAPVIIYMVSPKVIHVDASEFMSLVQRLTGPAGATGASARDSSESSGGHGDGGGGRVHRPLPVKVKASKAALKGPGPGEQNHPMAVSSDMSPTLNFHDLSPPSFGIRKDGAIGSSPTSWLLHGDFLDHSPGDQSDSALVSSSSFLDMLSQLPER